MNIGIIGLGTVGSAIKEAFAQQQHVMVCVDRDRPTRYIFDDLLSTDCVFVCVNTPTVNNRCDLTDVAECLGQLEKKNYRGLIIIKSTVIPGSTIEFSKKHPTLRICCVPEFLHQDYALHDFMHEQKLCVIGTTSVPDFRLVESLHRPYIERALMLQPTEAELAKYFVNNFNALRVVFANAFYEACQHHGVDYQKVLAAAIDRPAIGNDTYLHCNENLRGFEGACLPKDLQASATMFKELGLPITLFEAIINDNKHYLSK